MADGFMICGVEKNGWSQLIYLSCDIEFPLSWTQSEMAHSCMVSLEFIIQLDWIRVEQLVQTKGNYRHSDQMFL